MKKKLLVIALLFIIIIIFGVYYLILNSSNNHTFSLDTVAITLDDIDGDYILENEIHWTEPGNFTNSTGDGSKWNYTEHYQSFFLQNTTTNNISKKSLQIGLSNQ